jgi:hypothetical protein
LITLVSRNCGNTRMAGFGPSGLTPRHVQQKIDALESSVGLVAEQSNRTEDPVMTDEMMTLRTLLEKSSGR